MNKKKKGGTKKKTVNKHPPASYRFCTVCRDVKRFVYSKKIGHSKCENCGAGFAIKKKIYALKSIRKDLLDFNRELIKTKRKYMLEHEEKKKRIEEML